MRGRVIVQRRIIRMGDRREVVDGKVILQHRHREQRFHHPWLRYWIWSEGWGGTVGLDKGQELLIDCRRELLCGSGVLTTEATLEFFLIWWSGKFAKGGGGRGEQYR
jgi:hypothetical protein